MAAVVDNEVRGVIRELGPGANVATVTVTFGTLTDGSTNLPVGNGRFENGTITVGPRSSSLTGNGNDFFQGAAGGGVIHVPFTMVDANSTNFVAGTVTQMIVTGGGLQSLMRLSASFSFGAYDGGTIVVGGGVPASIVSSGTTTVLTTGLVDAPFRAHDDDDDTLLPSTPDTSLLIPEFASAYVLPVFDGGGNGPSADNQATFTLNRPSGDQRVLYRFDSRTNRRQEFWVIYILNAFQGRTDEDADANPVFGVPVPHPVYGTIPPVLSGESPSFGEVDDFYGGGAAIWLQLFSESFLATLANRAFISPAATTLHEVGHLFGGSHDPVGGYDRGVMDPSVVRTSLSFTPTTINKIRNTAQP